MTDYSELKELAEQGSLPPIVSTLIADCESAHKHWANESNNVQAAVAEVVRLTAENEALRKDAERYRWLPRNACDVTFWASGSPLAGCVEIDPRQYPVEVHGSAKASMDEQIDAVMNKETLE